MSSDESKNEDSPAPSNSESKKQIDSEEENLDNVDLARRSMTFPYDGSGSSYTLTMGGSTRSYWDSTRKLLVMGAIRNKSAIFIDPKGKRETEKESVSQEPPRCTRYPSLRGVSREELVK